MIIALAAPLMPGLGIARLPDRRAQPRPGAIPARSGRSMARITQQAPAARRRVIADQVTCTAAPPALHTVLPTSIVIPKGLDLASKFDQQLHVACGSLIVGHDQSFKGIYGFLHHSGVQHNCLVGLS
jgi:hypothetical protein